jgi:hypothetical protein
MSQILGFMVVRLYACEYRHFLFFEHESTSLHELRLFTGFKSRTQVYNSENSFPARTSCLPSSCSSLDQTNVDQELAICS